MRSALVIGLIATLAGAARADAEHDAYERARPVFEKYCTKCHTSAGADADDKAMEHLDMTHYPFGGHHAATAGKEVREAVGAAGEPASMPDDKPGAVQGDDLKLILAWADAFDAAHPAGDGGMAGMDMHDHDMAGMEMGDEGEDALPVDMMRRTGSGTAWQPDATPSAHNTWMFNQSKWMMMFHYSLHAGFDAQSSSRGDSQPVGLGWAMAMLMGPAGGGELDVRAMVSPEPIVLGKRGYPLLLQSGEEVGGQPLHDRQHPHDLFMELAVRWARPVTSDLGVEVYAAPVGEPALGPVAFAHRPYSLYDMTAPLGHHWMDSTHVSFGVLTAGVFGRRWKLEGSWFNGREPDEFRYDIDLDTLDSWSARATVNPSPHWSVEASYGHLAAPEAAEPGVSVGRAVASATYAAQIWGHRVDATAAIGHNMPSSGEATTAGLVEASGTIVPELIGFTRIEVVDKSGVDLDLSPSDAARTFGMAAFAIGVVKEWDLTSDGFTIGVGARGSFDVVSSGLESYYGTRAPVGGMIYVELHPIRTRSWPPPMPM